MFIGLKRASEELELEARLAKKAQLCTELHYVLTQAAFFLLGMTERSPGGTNTRATFFQVDRANELRDEIEALENGAPL
jgi:hypothetical protein